ncbi:MAG: hypothetical protein KY432_06040 [Acidobacteria bacterium]|nr:hypothetical protein [Acidobacteriota bacterium]
MKKLILIGSLILVLACQGDEPLTIETSGTETSSATVMGGGDQEPQTITDAVDMTLSETAEPSLLESAELRPAGETSATSKDGVVTVSSGDEMEIEVRVKQVPAGLAAWVHWLGPDGEKIAEEQKTVPESRVVTFRTGTRDWDEGDYTAEIFIGGDLVEIKDFRVTSE